MAEETKPDEVNGETGDAAAGDDWGEALAEQAEAEAGTTAEGDDAAGDDWGEALAEQAEAKAEGDDADGAADEGWGEALAEQADAKADAAPEPEPEPVAEQSYTPAPTPNLTEQSGGGTSPDLETILDIPVTLSMELGRTSISIRNLLQLNQGSVVELERLAGEPLDVYANGTLVAHGEVVVVNEKFGIRMTDVISPQDRVKKLS